ncbi:HpcH/HpaI aldolase family protein [Tateyamaria sp. SN6-1]|uniref:HpcH/HpaI aldolase family protein n=1 Tax=Tateyamaria sp. SN6-1 TaxID=3092148 RepID=UPI0039F45A1E
MRQNPLKPMLASGATVVNAWLSIPSGYLAEGVGQQGFNSVTVDLQHGMIGFETAVTMLQAISATAATPLVRAPSNDPHTIMHLLDAGAYGVICPMISTPQEAADFVAACRYPPAGNRSFGPARGKLYGGADYFDGANDEILAIPMIETRAAVENIDAILGVAGVDMIYVGPNDLALDLGERPGAELDKGETTRAIDHVLSRAKAAGVATGIFCADAARARQRLDEGFNLVTPGNDFNLLMNAMSQAVRTCAGDRAA